jgi:quercetin dioxygenase-like cupin family protein
VGAFVLIPGCGGAEGDADQPAEIDAVTASPSQFKVLLENDEVRVVEYALAAGEKDFPHTHPPKVSYVISGGKLLVHPKEGEPFEADETTGEARWDDARPWHYVENIGATPVRILLVEVKAAATRGQ